MTEQKKILFVIPCYNDGQFIRNAIASVEDCPSELCELIIVDDGSTDDKTIQILSELEANGYRVLSQENRGPAAARNAGIAASDSAYILPLDADNTIRPEFIEKAVNVLNANPEISIVHSNFQYSGLADHVCEIGPFDIRQMLYTNSIDTCALFRRKVWEDCGGYDEHDDLGLHEDWEFWLNAYSHGKQFFHVDMVGFDYTCREGSRLSGARGTENWQRAEQYLYSKHALLLRDHYRDYHRWDYHGRELRRRPIRTLFRLFVNAVSKRVHNRIYRVREP